MDRHRRSVVLALAIALALGLASAARADHDVDCSGFSSQADAQEHFREDGGSPENNAGGLDANGDGVACEEYENYPYTDRDETPATGEGGGGHSHEHDTDNAEPTTTPDVSPTATPTPRPTRAPEERPTEEPNSAPTEIPENEGAEGGDIATSTPRAPEGGRGDGSAGHGHGTTDMPERAAEGSYEAVLRPMNGSSVTGEVALRLEGDRLEVRLRARGLAPDEEHQAHAHGLPDGHAPEAPDDDDDANGDGLVAGEELMAATGAHVLEFEPFPSANAAGAIALERTYRIDRERVGALTNLLVIVHGGVANGAYDPKLAVAAGVIERAAERPGALPASGSGGLAGGAAPVGLLLVVTGAAEAARRLAPRRGTVAESGARGR